ncbi:hypothetical protein ACHAXS_000141 [Conticribra weissflogii]
MISCTGFWDTSISQNLISQCNIIPLNSKLNEESQELCVIITPFGKYKYKHLYMGLKCAFDLKQQIMEQVLHGLDDITLYIDDIGVFGNTWEEH